MIDELGEEHGVRRELADLFGVGLVGRLLGKERGGEKEKRQPEHHSSVSAGDLVR